MPVAQALDRTAARARYLEGRARTRQLFAVLDDAVYYDRPIALRNPIVFYEGHIPAFAVNTLLKNALGEPGIDAHLETIFARGIDPESEATAIARGNPAWPSRNTVRQYAAAADERILRAIDSADLERPGHPLLDRAQALWTILEHEEMHQETFGYICHQVPYALKSAPAGYQASRVESGLSRTSSSGAGVGSGFSRISPTTSADLSRRVRVPAGTATLGTNPAVEPFAWDNELAPHQRRVDAFEIDLFNVTNGQYLEFVEAGGYADRRLWTADDLAWLQETGAAHPPFWERQRDRWLLRCMFEEVPLPQNWPVYVTWAEASAYARWKGRRLLTEAEYHRAAFGTPEGHERRYPWGDTLDGRAPANFEFQRWDPEPVGNHPEGASAFGVHDLVGNGWEWTASVFEPFDGFAPLASYPEYSADFFDNGHFVMKGASPITARGLVRRGFRNWFRPRYPYVYATFRCVEAA